MKGWVLGLGIALIVIGIVVGVFTVIPGIIIGIIGAAIAIVGGIIGGKATAQKIESTRTEVTKPAGEPMVAGTMESMVKMLAQAPEEQRREMIRTRLSSFAEMRDSERVDAMKMMLHALQKLGSEDLKKITYTRLEALAEDFDASTRKKLMGAHMMVLMGLPKEQMMADVSAMVSVMSQCHDKCRMSIMGTMKELMMEMPQDKRSMMMQMLPGDVQKMLMA